MERGWREERGDQGRYSSGSRVRAGEAEHSELMADVLVLYTREQVVSPVTPAPAAEDAETHCSHAECPAFVDRLHDEHVAVRL